MRLPVWLASVQAGRSAQVAVPLAVLLLVVPTAGLATHGGFHTFEQTTQLQGSAGQQLGTALAADGDTLVAGGQEGPVHVYERIAGLWRLIQQLEVPTNPHVQEGEWGFDNGQDFGEALAIDDSTGVLAVGAPGLDVKGNLTGHETDAGAVYVYERKPNGTWNLTTGFLGPVDGDWNDQDTAGNANLGPSLGFSVAVQGDTIVAGAPFAVVNETPLRGIADVYERDGDDIWRPRARLDSPSPDAEEWGLFGFDVSVTEERFAVGAPGETSGTGDRGGSVHLYQEGGNGWMPAGHIRPDVFYTEDEGVGYPPVLAGEVGNAGFFGTAVDFDADGSHLTVGELGTNRVAGVAVPGAPEAKLPLGGNAQVPITWGSAHVFRATASGYAHEDALGNPDREIGSGFGFDLSMNDDGNTVVVGANLANQTEWIPETGTGLETKARWVVSDRGLLTHHPATGAAYVFESASGSWACTSKLSGNDTDHGDQLGLSVAASEASVFAGAPQKAPPSNGGHVYGFAPGGGADWPGPLTETDVSHRCGPVS